jgi:carbamoyl-phosphate synthase large subunit
MYNKIKVMIAGIGGASLGTEIRKSLTLTGDYEIYGCDISNTAYGLYEEGFVDTYHVSRDNYVTSVLNVCIDAGVEFLIPGGEQPMGLLGAAMRMFSDSGITVLANTTEVITECSDKNKTFIRLEEYGIPIPKTRIVNTQSDIEKVGLPCVVKPATGTGGSVGVFFVVSIEEALIYADFIRRMGSTPIAQEYIDDNEGEFTIGVLSLPNSELVGSIALRRVFDAKLSVAYRGKGGLISSGYSQGHIDKYPEICQQAEDIALAINSCGAINIQGRVRDGILMPFEINPRFSASSYLRSMAGFNEVDILIKYLINNDTPHRPKIKPGWYLRSLTEQYILNEEIK